MDRVGIGIRRQTEIHKQTAYIFPQTQRQRFKHMLKKQAQCHRDGILSAYAVERFIYKLYHQAIKIKFDNVSI